MVVLNEHAWAEEQISARSLGQKPLETMRRVARYYLDTGIPRGEMRRTMESFLLQCDPTASLTKWTGAIDQAIRRAEKYPSIQITGVDVTRPEMDRIDSLKLRRARRLAFTLLCLAKYWDIVNPRGDHWVNTPDSEVMAMANINTSIKQQSMLFHKLQEEGLIEFSRKVDNTNVRVLFLESGETIMQITDFRNLGNQYLMFHGEPYYACRCCGLVTKQKTEGRGPKRIYCPSCAAEMSIQRSVNAVMRFEKSRSSDAETYIS